MIHTLLQRARIWSILWRSRLRSYWYVEVRDRLPFVAMISLPVAAVVAIVLFAYLHTTSVAPGQLQALQLETKRAQRRESDLQCLAENIYFEARGEPLNGQYAVAEVTLNRTRAQHFPHTVCAVVHEVRWDPGRRRAVADFSWTEFGDLSPQDGTAWKRAMAVANAAYDDLHDPVVPGALFYHSTSIRPGWARDRTAVATIGNHMFYR
jgi:N-acetylmuramoyl-L-alanine amidase